MFGVKKQDLETLTEALKIPESFYRQQRSKIDGMEGLCMLLRRFVYPCRYSDMVPRFGRPVSILSMANNKVGPHMRYSWTFANCLEPIFVKCPGT